MNFGFGLKRQVNGFYELNETANKKHKHKWRYINEIKNIFGNKTGDYYIGG